MQHHTSRVNGAAKAILSASSCTKYPEFVAQISRSCVPVRRAGARSNDSVVGSPGANDNGSGVAALLEISRRFVAIEPAMTVRFVAFVNEEPPFFMSKQQGSMVYAKSARHRSDDIRLMASLETIGWYSNRPGSQHYPPLFNLFYPNRANFIGFVCDFHSGAAMRRLAHAFKAHSDFPLQTAAIFRFVP